MEAATSIAMIGLTPALAAAVSATTLPRRVPRPLQAWVLTALAALLFIWLLTFLPAIHDSGAIEVNHPWLPELGLTLSLRLDGLSLLFSLVITGIGAAIILYSGYYFDDIQELGRFYALLLAFMSAMLALVLAGNLLTLFIAWELTSILSFLLISFYGDQAEARRGALQALVITGGGGLALLVGLVLMGVAAGTSNIGEIIAGGSLHQHAWYSAITVLVLIGCFSKSAQFPLHFWLPDAMSAPTPASAYLHSATMVKAGIYLLARLYPVLGETPLWQNALATAGLSTMALGAFLALRQRDLKACLAYSTMSQLGALTALLSLPHAEGLKAVLVGVMAHSLYKATLFLMVGAVDHATGTRNLDELGGIARTLPGWALVAAVAALSMAGIPPLLGFVAKETLLDALLASPLALAIVVFSAVLTVTMALILVWEVFLTSPPGPLSKHGEGERNARPTHHELPAALLVGPAVLAFLSLLTGLQLERLVAPVIDPTLEGEFHLQLFAGFNIPFFLSLVALPGGISLFTTRAIWRRGRFITLPKGREVYEAAVQAVERVGDVVLRAQGGKIRYYLIAILISVSLLMATAGLGHLNLASFTLQFRDSADVLRVLLLIFALGTTLASIFIRSHLIAALILGVGGYSVGGLFLLEPAPDVALVQFMVETIGTVLLIIMLGKISAAARERAMQNLWSSSRAGVMRDAVIAGIIGIGVSLFALAAVLHRPPPQTIATWHLENAQPEIGITDVVGAIVTDFRGMDTVIEISVFSMAALGVFTLLTASAARPKGKLRELEILRSLHWRILRKDVRPETQEMLEDNAEAQLPTGSQLSTPMTRTIARLVLPFALLVALAQLFYGGDGPGDGFTAGVISGLGVALWYIVFGYHESRRRLRWLRPRRLIAAGMGLVILNASVPLLFGYPFLAHIPFDIPLPANLHISTTFLFETGIFLTVLGSSSMIMEAIAHPGDMEAQ